MGGLDVSALTGFNPVAADLCHPEADQLPRWTLSRSTHAPPVPDRARPPRIESAPSPGEPGPGNVQRRPGPSRRRGPQAPPPLACEQEPPDRRPPDADADRSARHGWPPGVIRPRLAASGLAAGLQSPCPPRTARTAAAHRRSPAGGARGTHRWPAPRTRPHAILLADSTTGMGPCKHSAWPAVVHPPGLAAAHGEQPCPVLGAPSRQTGPA